MRDEFHGASSCYFMRGQDLLCLWRWHTLIGLWEIRAWRTVSLPPNLLPPPPDYIRGHYHPCLRYGEKSGAGAFMGFARVEAHL